jgi:hypothetical protein
MRMMARIGELSTLSDALSRPEDDSVSAPMATEHRMPDRKYRYVERMKLARTSADEFATEEMDASPHGLETGL